MALAAGGIPVFPRAVLIDTLALGSELVSAMDGRDVCLMRGHGITVAGRTVEEATVRAIKLEALARVTWQLKLAGQPITPIPDADIASFVRPGGAGVVPGGERLLWRHYAQRADGAAGAR
jgi:3,4-dihydroxyphthalate decarboxylase